MRRPIAGEVVRTTAKAVPLAFAAVLSGCTSAPPVRLDEWGGAQNCHFAHISKQQFETALRRVFNIGGPKIYGLRPEEGGALVERHWALDVVFASSGGDERWRLEYAPAGDGIDARAEVERTPRVGLSPPKTRMQPPRNAASYQLLWSRIAYVLGNRVDWPACESSSKTGLCSVTSSGSPPLKLAGSR